MLGCEQILTQIYFYSFVLLSHWLSLIKSIKSVSVLMTKKIFQKRPPICCITLRSNALQRGQPLPPFSLVAAVKWQSGHGCPADIGFALSTSFLGGVKHPPFSMDSIQGLSGGPDAPQPRVPGFSDGGACSKMCV